MAQNKEDLDKIREYPVDELLIFVFAEIPVQQLVSVIERLEIKVQVGIHVFKGLFDSGAV